MANRSTRAARQVDAHQRQHQPRGADQRRRPQQPARLTRACAGTPQSPEENTTWWRKVWNFLTSLSGVVTMVLTAVLVYLTYLLVHMH